VGVALVNKSPAPRRSLRPLGQPAPALGKGDLSVRDIWKVSGCIHSTVLYTLVHSDYTKWLFVYVDASRLHLDYSIWRLLYCTY